MIRLPLWLVDLGIASLAMNMIIAMCWGGPRVRRWIEGKGQPREGSTRRTLPNGYAEPWCDQ
jgi:hypothetical protein